MVENRPFLTAFSHFVVLLGLVILSFVIRNLKGSAPPRISFVETGATYWHMVDVLWLVLFALLYLMR